MISVILHIQNVRGGDSKVIEVINKFKPEWEVCPYFSIDTYVYYNTYEHSLMVNVQCAHLKMCNFLRGEKEPMKAYINSDEKVVKMND